MKTILCFGDSNTWGYIPGSDGRRFPAHVRWPGVMAAQLGEGYRVVDSALNGRTTCWDDPVNPDRNGSRFLPVALESHAPIDLLIMMLGTNDLKAHLGLEALDIALGMNRLVEIALASAAGPYTDDQTAAARPPRVLLVSPVIPTASDCRVPIDKFRAASHRAEGLAGAYAAVAEATGCGFLDANKVAGAPDPDGIHLDERGHAHLGRAIAAWIASNGL